MTTRLLNALNKTSKLALGLAGCAAATVIAYAAVTIDEEGFGFVGKGDVQLAFGWNNAQLQANAAGVTFSYESLATYETVCQWTTGEGTRGEKTHTKNRTVKAGVDTSIALDARKNSQGQVTGFVLKGFVNPETDGDEIPEVGAPCLGEGTGATYVSVTLVGEASPGGLYANFADQKVLLEPTL